MFVFGGSMVAACHQQMQNKDGNGASRSHSGRPTAMLWSLLDISPNLSVPQMSALQEAVIVCFHIVLVQKRRHGDTEDRNLGHSASLFIGLVTSLLQVIPGSGNQ